MVADRIGFSKQNYFYWQQESVDSDGAHTLIGPKLTASSEKRCVKCPSDKNVLVCPWGGQMISLCMRSHREQDPIGK